MTTTCIIQARMGSTRLPGKVLQPIAGRPLLQFMLERLAALSVDALVVATSDLDRDDAVAVAADAVGVPVVRGSESDVLARFITALDAYPADTVVRLTADCPLMDPRLVEAVIATHRRYGGDYTTNTLPRSFPKGLDVEVCSEAALRRAVAEAHRPDEREHVTPYLYRHPESFNLVNHLGSAPLGREWWTVDTAADLAFVQSVVDQIGDVHASWEDILAVVGERAPAQPGQLVLRPAFAADRDRFRAWRNDDDAVRWSATGRAVEADEHASWFDARLHDAGQRMLVGEVDGAPVGFVRVDVRDAIGTVSIAVDPQRRGEGLGGAMLEALGAEMGADPQTLELVALVHPDHGASRRIFTSAGYTEAGIDETTGFVAFACPRSEYLARSG